MLFDPKVVVIVLDFAFNIEKNSDISRFLQGVWLASDQFLNIHGHTIIQV